MALSEQDVSVIGLILNTWGGFHKTRRRHGLYIGHCYVLLSCVWLESLNRPISEGSVRALTYMFRGDKLHYLFTFLQGKGFIVLSRQSETGRYKYYSLTELGRNTAIDLLNGIEAKQTEFFNKHLK